MKKLLIVVDCQNDFIDGALGFAEAEALVPRIVARIDKAHSEYDDVIFTLDTHDEDYMSTNEGRHLPVPHCIEGTPGHDLHPDIDELFREGDRIITKPSFGSADLFDFLRDRRYDIIELCGLVTDICVVSNAILAKTARPEAEIIVDASLTESFDEAKYEAALAVMESVQIKVIR